MVDGIAFGPGARGCQYPGCIMPSDRVAITDSHFAPRTTGVVHIGRGGGVHLHGLYIRDASPTDFEQPKPKRTRRRVLLATAALALMLSVMVKITK